MKRIRSVLCLIAVCALPCTAAVAYAQGVTTGAVTGIVTNAQQQPVAGAQVIAIHEPSGTVYETVTRPDGRYSLPNMRVGGPYTVTVAYGGTGGAAFEPQTQENVVVNLGVATDVPVIVRPIAVQEEVTVIAKSDPVFSSARTGAATTITRQELASLPSVTQQLRDITRLTPQFGGNMTFAGQDNRLNNITVDGSYFNNSFGLRSTPGETSGVAPISLDAIEEIQVSVAPFDVRQGNFVGAAVNTITRSGTNQFRGSFYHRFRDEGMVGTDAHGLTVNPGTFNFRNTGGYGSGPVVKNKLFFFGNFEDESLTQPGTTFIANPGGQPVGGNVTRVPASDLDRLSSFLRERFNYETGPYQGYDEEKPARRYLAKGDYNINNDNKFSFRYNHLDSSTDVLASNSSSLGFGSRRTSTLALNFQNSNYQILENIRSGIGEWNSIIGNTMANSLIAGYTHQDESRASRGTFFPFVDILEAGTTFTSFGFEPFTPNNELRYNTFQVQDNFTKYGANHSLTFGGSLERYESENVFFPGSQSVYVYNSLADFMTDANDFLANQNRTTSPIALRRFQVRWANIPGMEKPVQPLEVLYGGGYAQDEWRPNTSLTLTMGIRLDVPFFGDTAFANANADSLTFRDETGSGIQYSSGKLPDPNVLWSPRFGFNWDVSGDQTTQVRGGTGVFTGRPAYVWISNQIGNTGVLTGFEELDPARNTPEQMRSRPFNPDPNRYKPTNVTGAPASQYELALTNDDFKFPQLWRTNFAIDRRLPGGLIGTGEFIYGRDVNGIYYINANLPAAQTTLVGPDDRPRWTNNRIHSHVQNAIVLKNQNEGRSWNLSGMLTRNFANGFFVKSAYSYGEAKNTVDPGSIAFGSWTGNAHPSDPNNPGLAYSTNSPGHRFFIAGTFMKDFFRFGSTMVSVFWESRTNTAAGPASYTFAGDLNGDGGINNDLIYIHRDISEMNFSPFTVGARTFTAAEQAQAWNAYIDQDPYLSGRRGQHAERGAVLMPLVHRMDMSVSQNLFANLGGHRNSFEVRMDILNFGNLLSSNWGVGQRITGSTTSPPFYAQPLTNAAVDAQGRATYRLRVVNNELLRQTFERTAFLDDVYRFQISLRYNFN
jgi:hypothetical protein